MVHARVYDKYIHFLLIYTTYHIFPVLPIKHLVNKDGKPTTPHKLETGTQPNVSKLNVLFCPCVVIKATSHDDTKELNMCHWSQKGFWGIYVVNPKNQNRYLVYIPITGKIVSLHDIVFDKTSSSA